MAAAVSFGSIPLQRSLLKRPPLRLTPQRLEANRRNAARSTGPRTARGKARVARNPIKHGFFVAPERRSEEQHRAFAELFEGLCDDFHPHSEREEVCVAMVADSYVRMAELLRYENIAALKYHRECERELEVRIANADEDEAARLRAHREKLRRAGLWKPTIPGPRDAVAILRYEGRLHRTIQAAVAELDGLKSRKQTHLIEENHGFSPFVPAAATAKLRVPGAGGGKTLAAGVIASKVQKQTHFTEANPAFFEDREASSSGRLSGGDQGPRTQRPVTSEIAKTNPLSRAFAGNRHERRRAAAMARRRT